MVFLTEAEAGVIVAEAGVIVAEAGVIVAEAGVIVAEAGVIVAEDFFIKRRGSLSFFHISHFHYVFTRKFKFVARTRRL